MNTPLLHDAATYLWSTRWFLFTFLVVGVASANWDALSDYASETIYADWGGWLGHYMVEGGRGWIPQWWPAPIRSMARFVSDGWHFWKMVTLGAPLFYTAALLSDGWGEFALLVGLGYAVAGGAFFLLYHRLLHRGGGWHGI